MDSCAQAAADGGGGRSGGKILKRRPTAARKTPYDRPTPPPPLQPEKPNWLNGLLFPAKFVAGGASKLLSPFWNAKSWGSHSSSSSDSGSDSEGGIEDDFEHDEDLVDGAEPNQNKGSSSGKSEVLYLVEQLLMLEHYSREECDRLIKIINSQAVDYTIREGVDHGQNTSNQAITEARKMITENMVGTSSKSDLENSIHGSKSLATPNRDYLSGGSWNNIQNEIQLLHSKTIELTKPKEQNSTEAPKPEDEIVNMASGDVRTTQDDVPTEALSTLPSIKEQNQIAEEKVVVDISGEDLITEYAEVPDVNASQGSSNTKEAGSPTVKRAVRGRKYNTRRGRGRAK